ncbi:MAG: hypothetical protein HND48_21605 [Chloroflexi bacterium]|nr:hypothetical protein [Chloroflexota bacterium]
MPDIAGDSDRRRSDRADPVDGPQVGVDQRGIQRFEVEPGEQRGAAGRIDRSRPSSLRDARR